MSLPTGWREAVVLGRSHCRWAGEQWPALTVEEFLARLDAAIAKGGNLHCSVQESDTIPGLDPAPGEYVWSFHGDDRPPMAMISVDLQKASDLARASGLR